VVASGRDPDATGSLDDIRCLGGDSDDVDDLKGAQVDPGQRSVLRVRHPDVVLSYRNSTRNASDRHNVDDAIPARIDDGEGVWFREQWFVGAGEGFDECQGEGGEQEGGAEGE